MTKEDMLTLMATQVEHYTRRLVNVEADYKKWCNEAGAANDRVRKLESLLSFTNRRIAELEAALAERDKTIAQLEANLSEMEQAAAELHDELAERDARPVPANPYTVVVSELGATTASDACPHDHGTREWAWWMAKEMGVCVRHPQGNPVRYSGDGFHIWGCDGWREAKDFNSIHRTDFSTGWRIVDNPEAGQ